MNGSSVWRSFCIVVMSKCHRFSYIWWSTAFQNDRTGSGRTTQHIIVWLYFDTMVMISIFANNGASTAISRIMNLTYTKRCLSYFVLSTFGKLTEKCSVSIRPVMKCFIGHVLYSPEKVGWKPDNWYSISCILNSQTHLRECGLT